MSWAADIRRAPANWDYKSFDELRDDLPEWPQHQCTRFQWFQDKVEYGPISPIFATHEELSRYEIENVRWPWFTRFQMLHTC